MKQVIVVRTDLNMRKGKMVAQGAHASMKVLLDRVIIGFAVPAWGGYTFSRSEDGGIDSEVPAILLPNLSAEMKEWICGAFTKICVGVGSESEFAAIASAASIAGLPCAAIQDNGLTEFKGAPTWTALAIGPAKASDIDKITGHLKLL